MDINALRSAELLASFVRPFRSRESIERYQAAALARLVDHAWRCVPFYRRRLERQGLRPDDLQTPANLERLTPVSRRELQESATADRMAEGVDLSRCVSRETSGSSGEPLVIVRTPDEDTVLFGRRLRAQAMSGLRPWHLRVNLGSPRRIFLWHRIGAFRMRTVDDTQELREKADQVIALDPDVLLTPPETLEQLLEGFAGGRPPGLRHVFTGANRLRASLRRRAEAMLGARVTDFYGATEVNLIAWECHRCGRYHTVDDAVIVEVVGEDGHAVAPGEEGEVLVTALHSFAMPFIRFRMGDIARRPAETAGRAVHFGALEAIQGRTIDYLPLPGGRRLGPFVLLNALDTLPGLGRWCAVQHSETRITLEFEPLLGVNGTSLGHAIATCCRSLFPAGVEVEVCETRHFRDEAGASLSSKHRYVKSIGA